MTSPARTPGKFGRLNAQFPAGLRDLTYYVAGDLPKAPASVDVPAVTDWGVLGNDTKGDCGVAGLEHLFMAAAAETRQKEAFPGDQDAVAYYLHYTGGEDTGVVLSQYLAYVRRHGYFGHKVKAYAPVSVHDVPTLQTATYLYDGVYTGINVTQAMMDAFRAGQPWTLEMAQDEIIGGHCVPVVGYDSRYLYPVTWGTVHPVEYAAWHQMSSEAWAVLSGELAGGDGHGVNLASLEADLDKLDVPEQRYVTPAPPEHDGLLEELAARVRDCASSTRQDVTELLAFLASHGL